MLNKIKKFFQFKKDIKPVATEVAYNRYPELRSHIISTLNVFNTLALTMLATDAKVEIVKGSNLYASEVATKVKTLEITGFLDKFLGQNDVVAETYLNTLYDTISQIENGKIAFAASTVYTFAPSVDIEAPFDASKKYYFNFEIAQIKNSATSPQIETPQFKDTLENIL